jgi:hypothetical protein
VIEVERFTEAIAERRRVCSCICPVAHGARTGVCQQFMEPGQPMMLERINDKLDVARCPSCIAAIRAIAAGAARRNDAGAGLT